MLGVKRYMSGSVIVHAVLFCGVVGLGAWVNEPSSHPIPLSDKKIKTPSQIVRSIAVSEDELARSLKQYEVLKSDHRDELRRKTEKVNDAAKEIIAKEIEISVKNKEIAELDEKIKQADKDRSDRLLMLEISNEKKRIKIANNLKNKKDKLELEAENKIRLDKKKKLEEQRVVNQKILMEIAARNLDVQQRELARIRGNYEAEIHNLLYDAWVLPYDRRNVNCAVELSILKSGKIVSSRFISSCPNNYKTMIDLAIAKIPRLPLISKSIFNSEEIINFIDRIN